MYVMAHIYFHSWHNTSLHTNLLAFLESNMAILVMNVLVTGSSGEAGRDKAMGASAACS